MIGATSDERTSTVGDPAGMIAEEEFAAAMQKAYGDAWQGVYKWDDPTQGYPLKLRSEADYRLQAALISAEYAVSHNDDINVYAYYFNHMPPGHDEGFYGSYHSSDLWYFFNSLRDDHPGQRPRTEADHRMADIMSSYLANFVETGDPNGEGLPEWPQPTDGTAFMRFADGYAYGEATWLHWGEGTNNPVSALYASAWCASPTVPPGPGTPGLSVLPRARGGLDRRGELGASGTG